MDPRQIAPLKLSMSQIRCIAEEFRHEYIFSDDIPVNIEQIIEDTKGISVIPLEGLHDDCDMDGIISKDLKYIYIDEDYYNRDKYYKRVRFTIAHEVGHLVLHRQIIDGLSWDSEEDWKRFRQNLQKDALGWFETQASEFAGRILVPVDKLTELFLQARTEVTKMYTNWNSPKIDDDTLFNLASPLIAPKFGVSEDVIERRLRKENVLAHIG